MKDKTLYEMITASDSFTAGDMEAHFSRFLTSDGRSSYEELMTVPNDFSNMTALDLPSGSGPIAKKLVSLVGPKGRVLAVDFNQDELDLVPAGAIEKIRASAQELPIESESVDFVFCHLGLMLFSPLEQALAEIARILKDSGLFVANLVAETSDPIFNNFSKISNQYESHIQDFPGWGDPDIFKRERFSVLSRKLKASGFSNKIEYSKYSVFFKGIISDVIKSAHVFFQVPYILKPNDCTLYFEELWDALSQKTQNGIIQLEIPFDKLIIRK